MAPLYLDDFAVGQVYRSPSTPINQGRINAFAMEFDPQPFHLDDDAAATAFFGRRVASGWHTASLTMSLLLKSGMTPHGGLIGAGVEDMRWPRPTFPGDALHAETEVLDVRVSQKRPDRGLVKVRTTTLNQNNEPVQVMTITLVVPTRQVAGDEVEKPR